MVCFGLGSFINFESFAKNMGNTQIEFVEGVPTSWDDVKGWGDLVTPAETSIIRALEAKASQTCSDLHREGACFYYCGLDLPRVEDRTPSPTSPLYQRHVGSVEMQLFCMGDFVSCCYQNGTAKREDH